MTIALVTPLALLSACETHDLGQSCELDEEAMTSTDSRTETTEVVIQDVSLLCDELICVGSDGREPYCSKKCRSDAACPDGFECRLVQEIGDLQSQEFCVWKRCEKRSDCGPSEEFCCELIEGSDPAQEFSLCAFSDNGSCK